MRGRIESEIIKITDWHDFPDYINALSYFIIEKLETFNNKNEVHLVFSAHGLPIRVIERGDPYENQINICVNKIIKNLSLENPYHICYQSKVGPIKWLKPSTTETIKNIAKTEGQDILVIPISFVSDHYETIYEIDLFYAEQAKKLGIRTFKRIDGLNDHPIFIKALSNIVLQHIHGGKP